MPWKIEFSTAAEQDLEALFYHFADSFLDFGAGRAEAARQALTRVQQIRDTAERLATAPYRGEIHAAVLPGLRNQTLDKAIYWALLDEQKGRVRVLAIFYGGQDHQRKMLLRLLSQS